MVDITVDDATYMIMKLKNGAVGTIECSKIATGTSDELRFEIHGSKGALCYNSMSPNYLRFYECHNAGLFRSLRADRGWQEIECVQLIKLRRWFPARPFQHRWLRGHVHSLYTFCDNVYNGRPGCPSIDDGAYIQYVMECVAESAAEGRWVKIAE